MGYRDEVLKDRPVGYWPLWERSGTIARDWAGYSGDLTLGGSPTLGNPGLRVEPSVSMGFASGMYSTVPDAARFNLANVAMECWQYRTSNAPSGYARIILHRGLANSYALGLVATTNVLVFTSVGVAHYPSGYTIPANTICHVVCTVVGTTLTFYVNGAQVNQQTIAALSTGSAVNVAVGNDPDATTQCYFPGRLADVAIYPSLSPPRVLAHYNAGRGIFARRLHYRQLR